jgi:hypothetical protein
VALADMRSAVERQDVDAIYAMLDADARAALTKADVKALLGQSKREIDQRLTALTKPGAQVVQHAHVRYSDGEQSTLTFERGRYRVTSAGAFPSTARSPAEALGDLRRALARHSYTALMLVLSSDSRAALQLQIGGLVEALEQPEALEIQVDGDTATASAPGGHRVELRREDGVWKVRDFQ